MITLLKKNNVAVSIGSLNSVDTFSMKNDFMRLCSVRHALEGIAVLKKPKIGLLIGGDSKNYDLFPEAIVSLCQELKAGLRRNGRLSFFDNIPAHTGKHRGYFKEIF